MDEGWFCQDEIGEFVKKLYSPWIYEQKKKISLIDYKIYDKVRNRIIY